MKVLLIKSVFVSCCFTSAFTLANIIFHNFLELIQHYLKKDFRYKFPFINEFAQIPNALNGQNSPNMTKLFCKYFPTLLLGILPDFALVQKLTENKTKKKRLISSILLILEAKFYWQSLKSNNFKPIILNIEFLKWNVLYMFFALKSIIGLKKN